jgi:hypothetical protein
MGKNKKKPLRLLESAASAAAGASPASASTPKSLYSSPLAKALPNLTASSQRGYSTPVKAGESPIKRLRTSLVGEVLAASMTVGSTETHDEGSSSGALPLDQKKKKKKKKKSVGDPSGSTISSLPSGAGAAGATSPRTALVQPASSQTPKSEVKAPAASDDCVTPTASTSPHRSDVSQAPLPSPPAEARRA